MTDSKKGQSCFEKNSFAQTVGISGTQNELLRLQSPAVLRVFRQSCKPYYLLLLYYLINRLFCQEGFLNNLSPVLLQFIQRFAESIEESIAKIGNLFVTTVLLNLTKKRDLRLGELAVAAAKLL